MNANDFINVFEFEDIIQKIENKEAFEFEKIVKEKENKYTLRINGCWHTSWEKDCNEEVYHTFINFDYRGKIGIGGQGGAVEFETYEELKNEINSILKRYPEYEPLEQLSFVL